MLPGRSRLPWRQMLEGWLHWHRETLMAKCAGLKSADLARTTVEPSTLSLLGLVRHTAEIEPWWFRRSFAGEALGDVFTGPEDGDEGRLRLTRGRRMPAAQADAGIGAEIRTGSPPQAGYHGSPPAAWCG
ncbi:mycothiol transferase [Streptomyces sp. NPDC002913]